MDWKNANLHIENLVPGMFLAGLASLHWGWKPTDAGSGIIIPAVFIAMSYGAGVISAVLSRAIVDRISESGPRAFVLWLYSHRRISDLHRELAGADSDFNSDYSLGQKKLFRIKVV